MGDPAPKCIASGDLKPGNLALMPTLMLSIGLLVLLSAGLIVAVNWFTGRAIVQEFATRLIARGFSIQELALRRHLDAAVDQATFIADAIRDGRYKLFDPAIDDFMRGTMAAAPQVGALILADPTGKALRIIRGPSNTTLQLDHPDITGDRQLAEIADEIRLRKDPYWGPPVYRELTQTTYLNYRVPIRKGDMYLGFVTLAVSTRALSILVKELSEPLRSATFMLYGRDRILAHQAIFDGSRKVSEDVPLHLLRTFGDRVIENYASAQPLDKAG
jgi:adenylate cyclase